MQKDYLFIGKATDLKNARDRFIFRLLEIMPGVLSWATLIAAVVLSWRKPFWTAVFIISFVVFWFLRTIYLSWHLRTGFKQMKENEKINWLEKLKTLPNWQDIYHLVILPMHQEPLSIVKDTFLALSQAHYPPDKIIVVLGCEERAKEHGQMVAKTIQKEFSDKFFKLLVAFHPANIPGEIAGKGANETWAVKKAKELIVDALGIPYAHIIVSSLDADTRVSPHYFSCLGYHYLTAKKPLRTSFQPIPLFLNNIWEAPVFSRIFSFSATFWHTINQERPEKLVTFSSHAMAFKALVEVGFRQTNVISDDSRIFWQCFLNYDGDYRVQPLFYPVSMDANCAKTSWQTLLNIYKQQRRWAYGVGDLAYLFFGLLKNKKIRIRRKLAAGFEMLEGYWSWATSSFLIFLLGWLPLWLGKAEFSQTLISYNLPKLISRILTVAMAGLVISIYLSFLLLPPRPAHRGRFEYLVFSFSWLFFPLMMIFFSALPALEAQTRWMLGRYMGFWTTPKVRRT